MRRIQNMRKGISAICLLLISFFLLLLVVAGGTCYAQQVQSAPQPAGDTKPAGAPTSVQSQPQTVGTEQMKGFTPEQQDAVRKELDKQGGALTPEAVKALKNRPEFRGLTPEEIAKGKELLNRREGEGEQKATEKTPSDTIGKQVPTPAPERRESLFDRMKKIGGYQEISTDLKPFGYDFFQDAATRINTQRQDIPVPTNYVVGPGDEVKILLWGRVNDQYNLVVDKNGNITIPQIGPVFVAGMTFEQMSVNVIQQVEKIIGASVNITMGTLKSIPVFILGDVAKPGAYTVGSFATITDALLIAGGPSAIGS